MIQSAGDRQVAGGDRDGDRQQAETEIGGDGPDRDRRQAASGRRQSTRTGDRQLETLDRRQARPESETGQMIQSIGSRQTKTGGRQSTDRRDRPDSQWKQADGEWG